MKNSKLIILLLLLSAFYTSGAQNTETDSLITKLNNLTKEDSVKVNLLNKIAFKTYISDINKAVDYLNEAKKLSKKINYTEGIINNIRTEALIESYKGEFHIAVELLYKALNIAEKNKYNYLIANIYNDLGVINIKLDNIEKAKLFLNRSLKTYETNSNKEGIASCCNNLGLLYKKIKNYPEALKCYQRANKIYAEKNHNLGMAVTYSNMGVIYKHFKNYDKSIDYYKKALEISKKINDLEGISTSYNNIGEIYFIKKEYKKALEYTSKSLKIAEYNNFLPLLTKIYKLTSDIYAAEGNYSKAYKNYKLYKSVSDSIFSISNIKKISDIENKYKYDKKIEIENIKRSKQEALRKEKEKEQRIVRNILIFGIIMSMLFISFISYLFYQKSKANKILKSQKEEITLLNEELSSANETLFEQKDEIAETLEKLKKTQSQLLQREKMASIGILTLGVAHEINNPLNFITGAYTGIKNYFKNKNIDDKDINVFLGFLETGINRISEIVNGLTKFSKTDKNIVSDCDIRTILDNCLQILKTQFSENIKIEKQYASENFTVKCNEGDLHQAFINILLNAAQSIPEKGLINVKTAFKNKNIEITISDTGAGIKKQYIKKVFDPFFTTKEPGKGTGLGLSIVYGIIKEHNGEIKISSDQTKGTSVTVKLPVTVTQTKNS